MSGRQAFWRERRAVALQESWALRYLFRAHGRVRVAPTRWNVP